MLYRKTARSRPPDFSSSLLLHSGIPNQFQIYYVAKHNIIEYQTRIDKIILLLVSKETFS